MVKNDSLRPKCDKLIFDYASILYHGYGIHGTNDDESRLHVLMNSYIRFICNLSNRDYVSEKYIELGILNAYFRRSFLICCFIYNFLETNTPSYLNNIFVRSTNNTRAGTDTFTLMVKMIRLTRDEHLFAHCACRLWNNIPMAIRNSETKEAFAKDLKEYYLILQEKK